jgi:hypothetical protein
MMFLGEPAENFFLTIFIIYVIFHYGYVMATGSIIECIEMFFDTPSYTILTIIVWLCGLIGILSMFHVI